VARRPRAPARIKSPTRIAAEARGRGAEQEIVRLLEARGFTLLGLRARTARGEVDVVAANREMLLFVEVKQRPDLAATEGAVPPRAQARLLRAAEALLALNPSWARPAIRFDVAFVLPGGITIIEDALRL
jgi:putative endonuclease